jgi:hypothetical protein
MTKVTKQELDASIRAIIDDLCQAVSPNGAKTEAIVNAIVDNVAPHELRQVLALVLPVYIDALLEENEREIFAFLKDHSTLLDDAPGLSVVPDEEQS